MGSLLVETSNIKKHKEKFYTYSFMDITNET